MSSAALGIAEKDWDDQLFSAKGGVATMLGWTRTYHTLRSKGSDAGFPDRVCVRERVIYLELKAADGKPSDAQKRWIRALLDAGAEIYIARPSDLDVLAIILAHRGDPWQTGRPRAVDAASRLRQATRQEVS